MRICICILLLVVMLAAAEAQTPTAPAMPIEALDDCFAAETLDAAIWRKTAAGVCAVEGVEVVGGRLRVRVGTLGESDEVVWRGVRTARPLSLAAPGDLSFEVDWNDQVNGCYLEAGAYLSPIAVETTPDACSDWWKITYVGVPPGRNSRAASIVRINGGDRVVYDEGWPAERTGRKIGRQRVSVEWDRETLRVLENGRLLLTMPVASLGFKEAYLYLQVKCHSNYPPREIFFDNVSFRAVK